MATASHASFVATFEQVGSNVVVTGSGSFSAATFSGITPARAAVDGGIGPNEPGGQSFLFIGPVSPTITVDNRYLIGVNGPFTFGTGITSFDAFPSAGSGPVVGIVPVDSTHNPNLPSSVVLPLNYVFGTALNDSMTWDNATFASLDLTPGTYVYTIGTADIDTFTIRFDTAVTEPSDGLPEPAIWALLATGLVAGATSRHRRRRAT
jgi:hypothetical protein